jgi:hypothetical protein
MMKKNWMTKAARNFVLVASGGTVLGTSCMEDVRDAAVSGGLDFVESTATLVLESLIPIDETLNPE